MSTFKDLGLSKETLEVLEKKGFEKPTQVQSEAIPAILTQDKDIVAQAQTGTGKTAAFGLPILERIKENSKTVQALILAPTRELAVQVTEELISLKGSKKLDIVPIYGGQSIDLQLRRLRKGVDIVVGTPGRVIDHLKRKTLKVDSIQYLVLDEADEMLNMGFEEDVRSIIEKTPADKRVLLFSATMPPEIKKIAQKYMREHITIKVTQGQLTTAQTDQIYFEVGRNDKFEALCRIIDIEDDFYGLVFCRTKVDVDDISAHLTDRGYDVEALHGDISQNLREKKLRKFKAKQVNILIATDVAARGIDVNDLTHVINYALPQDPESYVHRIGRTGRAGKEGIAITFITPSEYKKLQYIQRTVKTDIRKEKLPTVEKIIEVKRQRIHQQLQDLIKTNRQSKYLAMSQELLNTNNADDVVASLLQYAFGNELSQDNYKDIQDSSLEKQGTTRLFIKSGKADGMTTKNLADLIVKKCRIENRKIRDVQVLDNFSFVTLPFHEAEAVLSFFKQNKSSKIFVQKAKAKTDEKPKSRGRFNSGDRDKSKRRRPAQKR